MNYYYGIQLSEWFDVEWIGLDDFDVDGFEWEMSLGQILVLVVWQVILLVLMCKQDLFEIWEIVVIVGEILFLDIGCVFCYVLVLLLDSLVFQDFGFYDQVGILCQSDVEILFVFDLEILDWVKVLLWDD